MIRLGIVGASPGSWAFTAHVPAIASLGGVRIAAVATTRDASAREAARLIGADAWFTDAEALARCDSVDAVVVAVKVPAHAAAIEAALAARKPVYCEWPLAPDAAMARLWADAADAAGIATAVGLQGLHGAAPRALSRLLQAGALGQIRSLHAQASRAKGLTARPVTAGGAYTLDAANGAGTREVPGGHLVGLVEHLVGIDRLEFGRALVPLPAILHDDAGHSHAVSAPDSLCAAGLLRGGGLLTLAWWDRDPAPCTRVVVHGTEGTAVLESCAGVRPALSQPQMAPLRLVVTNAAGRHRVAEPAESTLPIPAQNLAPAYERFLEDIRTGSRTCPGFSLGWRVHSLLDAVVPRTA